jgi:ribosomal-protein-alanine N-acetyltransferase
VTPPRPRPATDADLPACRALQSLLPERAPTLLDAGLGTLLVAGPRGAPVGYLLAVGVRVDDTAEARGGVAPVEPAEASDDDPPAHLAELVVAPDARRRGVGGALLDACLARAGPVTALVAPDNDAALALYRSRGFERVGERPDAFASGALVLRCPPAPRS